MIQKKRIAKIEFELISPLSLGNGSNNNSDKDLNRNALGIPYIPATSIAGICLNMFNKVATKEDVKKYFGYTGNFNDFTEGTLIFYDANLINDYSTTIRDGVGLDEYKTSITGAKYDFEVLNPGAKFVTYIEQNFDDEKDVNVVDYMAVNFDKTGFGANTTRGLGKIRVNRDNIKLIEFDFSNAEDVKGYLDFDIYSDWNSDEKLNSNITAENKSPLTYVIKLDLASPISIRVYKTDVNTTEGETVPDFVQMTCNGKPVIPGSSWAGAFRHHMLKYANSENNIDEYFGAGKERHKSNITFSESVIDGSKELEISRNKIDRFTGGAVENALFTEQVCINGETELTICLENEDNAIKKALAVSLADLNEGFMSVGGETGIGHGLFKIKQIDETEMSSSEDIYKYVLNKKGGQ